MIKYLDKDYKVRVGVIDLEAKLYTKLPLYINEVNEAYLNFVLYHNQDADLCEWKIIWNYEIDL